jgi:hypothetical protein
MLAHCYSEAGKPALSALRADKRQFFVECAGRESQYVKACCAWEAKANYIYKYILPQEDNRG